MGKFDADEQLIKQLESENREEVNFALNYVMNLYKPDVEELLKKYSGFDHPIDDIVHTTASGLLMLIREYGLSPYLDLKTSFIFLAKRVIEERNIDLLKKPILKQEAIDYKELHLKLKTLERELPEYSSIEELDSFDNPPNLWQEKKDFSQRSPNVPQYDYIQRLKTRIEQLKSKDRISVLKDILEKEHIDLDEFDALLNQLIALATSTASQIQSAYRSERANSQLVENADAYALSISSKVRDIITNGASTLEEVATGLKKAGIQTKNGNDWHLSTVKLLIDRLNRLQPDKPIELNKDAFLGKMSIVINEIRQEGATNALAIAKALNSKRIPTKTGKQWYAATVQQLLAKLEQYKGNGSGAGTSL